MFHIRLGNKASFHFLVPRRNNIFYLGCNDLFPVLKCNCWPFVAYINCVSSTPFPCRSAERSGPQPHRYDLQPYGCSDQLGPSSGAQRQSLLPAELARSGNHPPVHQPHGQHHHLQDDHRHNLPLHQAQEVFSLHHKSHPSNRCGISCKPHCNPPASNR